jgi:hypothetical protein
VGAFVEADVREDFVLCTGLLESSHFFAIDQQALLSEAAEEFVVVDWRRNAGLIAAMSDLFSLHSLPDCLPKVGMLECKFPGKPPDQLDSSPLQRSASTFSGPCGLCPGIPELRCKLHWKLWSACRARGNHDGECRSRDMELTSDADLGQPGGGHGCRYRNVALSRNMPQSC